MEPTEQEQQDTGRPDMVHIWGKRITFSVLAVAVIWFGFFHGVHRKSWTEDVLLEDGQTIKVARKIKLEEIHPELFQTALRPEYQSIKFPDGVKFETTDRLILLHIERGA